MPADAPLDVIRLRGRPRIADAEQLVLDAVTDLLEGRQANIITMDLVAERAGVSKITLYRRWPSKLALLVDAMLQRLTTVRPLDEQQPPFEAIRGHIISMVSAFDGLTGDLVRAVLGACVAAPEMSGMLRERYLGHRRELAIQIIERGLLDGSFTATGSAEMLHDSLYGAIWYRFLFEVGSLNRKQALGLFATVLRAAR